MKVCSKCKKEKSLDCFPRDSTRPDGLSYWCKDCKNADNKTWIANNHDRKAATTKNWAIDNAERKAANNKTWIANNFERKAASKKAWNDANKDRIATTSKARRKKNGDHIRAKEKELRLRNPERYAANRAATYLRRIESDLDYCIRHKLRNRVYQAIKRGSKAGSAVRDLGCTIDEFKVYLETKFLPGMTWDNWTIDGWHMDHIKALSKFDLTDPEQFRQAVHYTNLQPLWWRDNIRKGNR